MTEAATLHRDAVVVDTHNDLLMLVANRAPAQQGHYFENVWLPQLRAGGVDVQVLPVFVDDAYRPEGALRRTALMIAAAWRIADYCSDDVCVCLTGQQVDDAVEGGRIALVLALEGCEAVGRDVQLFEVLHRLGIRMASFTHLGRTMLADGSGEDDTGGRLTKVGVDAVAACEELGILLDISHLGMAGTDHLLDIASRPVVASHSSAFALRQHHRNLTDARLRGVAASGGVIGVNFLAGFIDPESRSVARVVDHIEHVADIAGLGHVGLGPDFIAEVLREQYPLAEQLIIEGVDALKFVDGLAGPAGLPLITHELMRRGWSDGDVYSILGGGWLSVFRSELGRPGCSRSS